MIQPVKTTALVLIVAVTLGGLVPATATAQPGQGQLEDAKALINEGTRELIDTELEMSASEAAAFWDVYERFDMEMDLLGDQYLRLLETYMDRYLRGVITDSESTRLIDEYLAIQIGMLRVRQKYLPQFRDVLGGTKATRLYQLQNKVKAQVDAALADVVPLVELEP